MDKNYTLSEMALHDKAALRGVIDLYMKWYDINWTQHVIRGKFHLDELMYIHEALSEDKFTIAITSLENNEQGSGLVDAVRLLSNFDDLVKKGGREGDKHALLSVWPILKQLKEAVRHAVNNANMLNTFVKGDAHAKAIRELKQFHAIEIQKLAAELTSMDKKISDVSGKLEEGIRGVEELRGVVAGHTDTLETKTSTAASQADHAAMKALAERVAALEIKLGAE